LGDLIEQTGSIPAVVIGNATNVAAGVSAADTSDTPGSDRRCLAGNLAVLFNYAAIIWNFDRR